MSALRIAIVIERFAPRAGGVENVAWQVAFELAKSGDDVSVITREAPPDDPPGVVQAGPTIHTVRVPSFWQPLRVLAFSLAVSKIAKRGDFDVVHSFSRTRRQDLYRAGGGSHRDYLRRTHSRAGHLLRLLSPRHLVLLAIEARVFADASQRIQCASHLVADVLVADHAVAPERILLLPNAVDCGRFGTPAATRAGRRLRAELAGNAERIWLFPASGWKRKGLPVLLEALAILDDPQTSLWIAGRDAIPAWRKTAERLGVADRVRFLGPRDDLEAVYAAVDGMVLPTRYDAFANVTLEAAASGLPIITTRSNGAAEWLPDALWLLESPHEPVALASALVSLADAERRRELGDRARKQAHELNWQRHASRLREEYRGIARARADRRSS